MIPTTEEVEEFMQKYKFEKIRDREEEIKNIHIHKNSPTFMEFVFRPCITQDSGIFASFCAGYEFAVWLMNKRAKVTDTQLQ